MKTALYARVSTVNGGQDPETQLFALRDYCKQRGWLMAEEYVDTGVSGSKATRKELDRMMLDARRRKFGAVLVWKFDRFARSTSHLLRALEEFKALGIEFVSLTEGIDTSTPMGKMVFTVLGAVAELERSLIVERVKAGLRNAKSKGRLPGKKRQQLDFDLIDQQMQMGASLREVAGVLKISPALLSKRLKERKAGQ